VRVHLRRGGGSVEIPGTFGEEWEDNEQVLYAWDRTRAVWLSAYAMTPAADDGAAPSGPDAVLARAERALRSTTHAAPTERLEYRTERLSARAELRPNDAANDVRWVLHGLTASDRGVAVSTIYFDTDAERAWALDTWRSVTP
jgi:hypothetical protein